MPNRLEQYSRLACSGKTETVDFFMSLLNEKTNLPTTKVVDYCLGLMETAAAVARIEFYLFYGTLMQRNYCTLFFARRNDWDVVNRAYKLKLIDYKQAYSR